MNFKPWRTVEVVKDVRRGSALLVVLGMLAFMLFSGLAFSVYMRQSRLPTSFLRRTATTRQLAKAALAEAIDHLDRAIGNDPHPGVRVSGKAFNENWIDNFWSHRVFFGMGSSSDNSGSQQSTTSGSYYPTFVGTSETVPTLTLEGLAYLPPNLINEARYYSQRTPTAKWHSFWFDSGRYAYTAIDVSDYFDVNRIQAGNRRDSCVEHRLSLSHLFEKTGGKIEIKMRDESKETVYSHGKGSGADAWDTFVDSIPNSEIPLVSLADFNIAWGSKSPGGLKCPFYNFLKNQDGTYPGANEDGSGSEHYRGMTFVTDSWYPDPSTKKSEQNSMVLLDLNDEQPFDETVSSNLKTEFDLVLENAGRNPVGSRLTSQCLSGLGIAALWDYLDLDDVPVSLAIPTTERVPMVCGIQPKFSGMSFRIVRKEVTVADDKNNPCETKDKQYRMWRRQYKYVLDLKSINDGNKELHALVTYPFKNRGVVNEKHKKYALEGITSMFLTDASGDKEAKGSLRIGEAGSGFSGLCIDNDNKGFSESAAAIRQKGVLTYPTDKIDNLDVENIKEGDEPCKSYSFLTRKSISDNDPDSVDLCTVTYVWKKEEWDPSANLGEGGWKVVKKSPDMSAKGGDFKPGETAAGSFVWFKASNRMLAANSNYDFLSNPDGIKLRINVAAWVRVSNVITKDTVDLVPACSYDDHTMNDRDVTKAGRLMTILERMPPVLRFNGPVFQFKLIDADADETDDEKVSITTDLVLSPAAAVIADPRYNHAPENWFTVNPKGDALSVADWSSNNHCSDVGKDGDCYMATSDQGWMQSVYELAFLPRLTNFKSGGGFRGDYSEDKEMDDIPDTFAASMNNEYMWRTYKPFATSDTDNDDEVNDFERLNIVSGDKGAKVNPYSDSTAVLMAAFANAPYDWRLAYEDNEEIGDMSAPDFNAQYAWNDYSPNKVKWEYLAAIAKEFKVKVRKLGNWEDAFADLKWYCDEWDANEKKKHIVDFEEVDKIDDKDPDGIEIDDLYSVDKKFLYGYWHDCFSARQQLFLIFVRAEPMMMGGGVKGQIPPQLGARAVALVWRDPTATTGTRTIKVNGQDVTIPNPHRTRVLFYHQFD